MTIRLTSALACAAALVAATGLSMQGASAAPAPAFVRAADIAAPDNGWDFASWDAEHGLLLVAHGTDVLVIDPAHQTVRAIGTVGHAHGVVAIPGTGHILVSSGADNTARVLDETTGAEIARIPVAEDPDAVLLSPDARHAYIMGAKAGAISVVDLTTNTELRRIALKPGLEVPVLVTPGQIAVNNEDASEIELADLDTRSAAGTIALPGCTGPTGLAYDPEAGLALSACANGQAALVDLRARRLVKLLPIGQGPDTAIWDAVGHRFLVPCGKSGTLSVIAMDGRHATDAPGITTEASARTAAYDPAGARLYLPAARFGPATTGKRGPIVPGSFHIVVMAPAK